MHLAEFAKCTEARCAFAKGKEEERRAGREDPRRLQFCSLFVEPCGFIGTPTPVFTVKLRFSTSQNILSKRSLLAQSWGLEQSQKGARHGVPTNSSVFVAVLLTVRALLCGETHVGLQTGAHPTPKSKVPGSHTCPQEVCVLERPQIYYTMPQIVVSTPSLAYFSSGSRE